jgi:hypothetical protein
MGDEAPRPRSPPTYPDLCGRRRLQLEVQILNREVGFLEVSRPCRTTNLLLFSSFEENRDRPCSCCLSQSHCTLPRGRDSLRVSASLSDTCWLLPRAKQRLTLAWQSFRKMLAACVLYCFRSRHITWSSALGNHVSPPDRDCSFFFLQQEMQERIQPVSRCCKE